MINNPEFQSQTDLTPDSRLPTPDILWIIGCFIVTGIAIVFRFWDLTLKPLHHDEGVNGYFLTTLFREGVYKYDPANYHGPTLYYISLAFSKLFGLETFSIRASVGVFGILLVILTFFLRKYIGSLGSLIAALFIGLSPGMVYISRYFIHEIFFVFCSFGIVLGILFFIEGRKAGIFAIAAMTVVLLVCFVAPVMNMAGLIGKENEILLWTLRVSLFTIEAFLVFLVMRMLINWNDGRPIYLLLASACAALFFATKETAFITIGTCLIACVCVWLWRKIYVGVFGKIDENTLETVDLTWNRFIVNCRESNLPLILLAVVIVFSYISVLFFTSFFTYPEGILKAFEAYAFWTKTGTGDHTQNGFWAYTKWGGKIESPILILSAVGTLIALIKGNNRLAIFTGFWAFGLFAAYTIIPYKTPWLALSFILPMCLVAGYGLNELFTNTIKDIYLQVGQKILAGLLTLTAIGVLSYQAYDLNFVRYDDDSMPYVYAHTQRGFLDLIKEIDRYAEKSGKGNEATIEIVSPDYWSMPWYTRNYSHANYHGKIVSSNTSEMIVAKKDEQDEEIKSEYASHYKLAGTYPLRPGVELMLLVRNDLADSSAKNISAEFPTLDIVPEMSPTPKKGKNEK